MNAILKLVRTELRLLVREPLVLAFVFAFPVITVLVIAGAFGTHPSAAFENVKPSQWYVSSYFAVVIAAMGLVMVPAHVAGYRERGVLRRFAVAGFPRWSFAIAQVVTGVILTVVASLVLLAVAGAVYGIPAIGSPVRVIAGVLLGATAFTSLGLLIGAWMPNARAAQGVGLLLFFPSFLLGGGGPPPSQMGAAMRSIANMLPLTHVADSIRNPWLGLGSGIGDLAVVTVVMLVAALGWRRAMQL